VRHYDQLTVSEIPAAVIVETLNPPDGAGVECDTPPLKVAVYESGYLRIITPDPPAPVRQPPPPPVLTPPLAGEPT
jgi:hypothetical protein